MVPAYHPDVFDRIALRITDDDAKLRQDNVTSISQAQFRRRCSKISEELFGHGFEIEEAKKQLLSDAMNLAPFLNTREKAKFLVELCKALTRGE
jgi:hypothetical protein